MIKRNKDGRRDMRVNENKAFVADKKRKVIKSPQEIQPRVVGPIITKQK